MTSSELFPSSSRFHRECCAETAQSLNYALRSFTVFWTGCADMFCFKTDLYPGGCRGAGARGDCSRRWWLWLDWWLRWHWHLNVCPSRPLLGLRDTCTACTHTVCTIKHFRSNTFKRKSKARERGKTRGRIPTTRTILSKHELGREKKTNSNAQTPLSTSCVNINKSST